MYRLYKMLIFSVLIILSNYNLKEIYAMDLDVYITGYSDRVVIIDPRNERYFISNIELLSGNSNEVFIDDDAQKFIIIQNNPISGLDVYFTDIEAKKLSKPIFSKKFSGLSSHTRSVWSQSTKTLCMIGFNGQKEGTRTLAATLLKFNKSGFIEKKNINLNPYLNGNTGVWIISDNVFLLGYKTRTASMNGGWPALVQLNRYCM